MARFTSPAWICLLFAVLATLPLCSAQATGVNWGTSAMRPLPAKSVIQLLKDNNFTKVKLFDVDEKMLNSFESSGLEVMVGAPNDMLQTLHSLDQARAWVKYNVSYYREVKHVNIKYVAIGNEPFLAGYGGQFMRFVVPALKNVQQAINDANYQDVVKVVVPMNADVLSADSNLPSETFFRQEYTKVMTSIVSLLSENGSPFVVNLYPYLSLVQDPHFPKDFVFFSGDSSAAFSDGNYTYTNVLEASIDSVANALAAVGAPDMPIVLGEVGWPTDGEQSATLANAQRFIQGLLDHSFQLKGTPRHPNTFFDFYLFGLLDEDAKSTLPGNFERHWGIFDYAGQAKYSLDLSGRGLKVPLVSAHVKYLGKKWCVLKGGPINETSVQGAIDYACSHGADCTVLADGASCSVLSLITDSAASFAFNSYYQAQGQHGSACNFQGFATVTEDDPSSTYNCTFPIAVSTSSSGPSLSGVPNYMYALFAVLLALAVQFQV